MTENIFAARLLARRLALGLTRRELAEKSNVPERTIVRYENGEISSPSLDAARKLAEVLAVSLDWLAGID